MRCKLTTIIHPESTLTVTDGQNQLENSDQVMIWYDLDSGAKKDVLTQYNACFQLSSTKKSRDTFV